MDDFEKMPKIELHLHLDGSLCIKNIKEKYNMSDEEAIKLMVADEKCENLNDYLEKFDFPGSIMQTKEELQEAVINLLKELENQNVIYTEIRFAPQFHTKKGLSQEEVVNIVVNAKQNVNLKCNFILCCMRGNNNLKENYETLEVAKKFFGKGVCAIDLAGAEAVYKTENYKELFEKANEYGIPFTIHAGEADGPESIKSALKLGAKRIGHGVRSIEDEDLVRYLIENNISLEVCPTSNIQTGICKNYETHPIERLYRKGVKVTINTDNMTVSNTCLAKEYKSLVDNTSLTKVDIINMNINSAKCAFVSDEEKIKLIELCTKM